MIAEAALSKSAAGSLLGCWEARLKVPALLLLIFSFAFVRDLFLLPLLVVVAIITYAISGLPLKHLMSRVRLPGFFLLAMAVILPFWSGQTIIWQLGPLALRQEGLLGLLLIAVKFISILTVVIALFGTTSLPQLTVALRALGIPWLITDLLLFTYRYLYQLASDLRRMRTAARLRGFAGTSLSALKPLAFISGTMLVRSHEQSERVFQAMTLRGYGNSSLPLPLFRPFAVDYLLVAGAVSISAMLILLQFKIKACLSLLML